MSCLLIFLSWLALSTRLSQEHICRACKMNAFCKVKWKKWKIHFIHIDVLCLQSLFYFLKCTHIKTFSLFVQFRRFVTQSNLGEYNHSWDTEQFYHSPKYAHALFYFLILRNDWCIPFPHWIISSKMPYKWNYAVCNILRLEFLFNWVI